jgi:hypothetical protein
MNNDEIENISARKIFFCDGINLLLSPTILSFALTSAEKILFIDQYLLAIFLYISLPHINFYLYAKWRFRSKSKSTDGREYGRRKTKEIWTELCHKFTHHHANHTNMLSCPIHKIV